RQPGARRHGARQGVSVRGDSLNADNSICDSDRELDRPPLDGETGACRPMVLREAAGDLLRAAGVPISGERLDTIATHAVSGELRQLRQVGGSPGRALQMRALSVQCISSPDTCGEAMRTSR